MTGFDNPGMLEATKQKRKSGWFVGLTCLVSIALVLATTQLRPAHLSSPAKLRNFAIRSEVVPGSIMESTSFKPTSGRRNPSGRTPDVQFDNYSLFLKGQRIFLHSGEFHTFRLPVPSLWPDILEKVKAAGMNAVSVYTHMGLINPSPGVVGFNGFRALQPLFDAAKDAGIWIVLRPDLFYINAETTAGGIAHWATSEVAGQLGRITFRVSSKSPLLIRLAQGDQLSVSIQVDNEYTQPTISHAEYFAQLEEVYHNSGIVVPLTYNDAGEGMNFINGTGAPDLYGLDSYPQRYNCSSPTFWTPVTTNYYSYHAQINPSQPFYFPEFQGGSFDAWGPTSPGYDQCRILTGPDMQSVFNLQLWASNAKMISYYMLYGGTSWGAIPFHGVYTSYDYGGTIAESRELTTKYDEIKRQAMFLRTSPEFYKTDWVADASTGLAVSTNSAAFVTLLRNPDTNAAFYIVRQNDSTSTAITTFKLNVTVAGTSLQIPVVAPEITLGGRESKVIVTDYAFGAASKLSFSTAQIFYASTIGTRDVLFLHGNSSQVYEAALALTGTPSPLHDAQSPAVHFTQASGTTIISFLAGIEGLVTVWDSDTQLVLYADSTTVATFWAPVLAGANAGDPHRNYWGIGTNTSILVGGPYLVRSTEISDGTLALRGDLKTGVRLAVVAPAGVHSVTWNGARVAPDEVQSKALTQVGGFVGQLNVRSALAEVKVPKLSGWKFKDSLPEIQHDFDDGSWTLANHTTTNLPLKPYYGDGRVLYGCDYGFCENIVLWRGHFKATGAEKSLNISVNGGEAFAASIWANDVFLGTSYGNSTNNRNILEETDDKFFFPQGVLKAGQDNVITVVQDNMGLNETAQLNTDSSKSPRGIRGFALDGNTFGAWKVQGKVGGYKEYPDKTRGVLNEGGLFGERSGWHLPGYPTRGWVARDLAQGLPGGAAGVGFFVTTFELDIPSVIDAMMSFTFDEPLGQAYRAILFVNGWMMGKRVANLGPQAKFPVHEGILNYHGENTIAVALWAMEPNAFIAPNLQLVLDAVYDGGIGEVVVDNPGWSSKGRH